MEQAHMGKMDMGMMDKAITKLPMAPADKTPAGTSHKKAGDLDAGLFQPILARTHRGKTVFM